MRNVATILPLKSVLRWNFTTELRFVKWGRFLSEIAL